jgi:hypothetical protein
VGLEKRNGRDYYYKSRRDGGKVRKVYIGAGGFARLAAQLYETERRQREQVAAYWKEKRERLEREVTFLRELEDMSEILTRAHLIVAGCHKHKGEWRKTRRG